ncbi:hypothetical protein TWF192_001573 [Orbilia oligospora]|uniref:Rhodopsin domain-containing protein n=2 Tax=Orbilia oligospora TaxID=2813651 RepID=A0A6G1LUC4_ORBOL|nr:hypothetical protein TWF679_006015 [Orbilia oligospora]KAF3234340.1 hypothetical protein TWF192_001573 [Orbilia oligospora]
MAPATPTGTFGGNPAGDRSSRHQLFLSITFVLLGIATIFVILRLYCRYFLIHRVGADDWLITIGIAAEWALVVMNYFQIKYGTGRHITTVTIDGLIPTLRYWFAYQILYPLVLLFIKLSILAFYIKISPQRWYQITVYVVGTFVIAWSITFIFAYIFECPNPSTAWSLGFPRGCVNLPALYYSTASINIASDLIILLLPIPVLQQLQINKRRKLALIAIFSVGVVAVAGSVARLWSLWKYQHTVDVSYDAIFILLFSHIEINLAIMCACAPALKPLFKSLATPFSSKVGDSGAKSSALASSGGGGGAGTANARPAVGSRVGSGSGAGNPSIARNRAKFEMTDPSKRESPESRVVKITGGTPYYTPPLEMARPKGRRPTFENEEGYNEVDYDEGIEEEGENDKNEEDGGITRRPPPAKYRQGSVPNFQLDGSFGFTQEQSPLNMRHANTINTTTTVPNNTANNRPGQFSKLAGEYTVTCSSTHSLSKSGADVAPDQQYFGFVYRPSIWRRQSVVSRISGRAKSAIGFGDDENPEDEESPDGRRLSEEGVKIEHEVRIDYELMTEEEKERWERKRSVLDAVDSLW